MKIILNNTDQLGNILHKTDNNSFHMIHNFINIHGYNIHNNNIHDTLVIFIMFVSSIFIHICAFIHFSIQFRINNIGIVDILGILLSSSLGLVQFIPYKLGIADVRTLVIMFVELRHTCIVPYVLHPSIFDIYFSINLFLH